ncbi:hypothetical protein CRUP_015432 [Coryphaenoides rupestris]|nr:hypothetical protein CRUP_015432 [Coryphaenoides rupestris]
MLYFLLFPGVCSALHYYYVVDTAMTWMDARRYCREHYNDLATIDSLEDQQRLEDVAGGYTGPAWIGLYDDVKSWTCLFLIDEKMTWLEAQSYCREHFTDLVSIRDENEYKVVAEKELILPLLLLGLLILISILNPHIYYSGVSTTELDRQDTPFLKGLGYTPINNVTDYIMVEVAQAMF